MSNHLLNHEQAFSIHQDNERKIAAAELRRRAKATCHAAPSPDRAVAARLPRGSTFGAGATRRPRLGRGLSGVAGRQAPA